MYRLLIIPVLALTLIACSKSGGKADLKNTTDSVSYSFGYDMGRSFRQQKVEVNSDAYLAGLIAGVKADTTSLTEAKMQEIINAFVQKLNEKQRVEQVKKGEENRVKGEKFLEDNKKQPGVVVLPSGLQYKIIKEGTGPKPGATDIVTVNYRGQLVDGKEFDSSAKHGGQPAQFQVSGVIPGFTEALKMMSVGAKWTVYIPANLAYGPNGAGEVIPPNSTLIFELELLGIKPAPAAAK